MLPLAKCGFDPRLQHDLATVVCALRRCYSVAYPASVVVGAGVVVKSVVVGASVVVRSVFAGGTVVGTSVVVGLGWCP